MDGCNPLEQLLIHPQRVVMPIKLLKDLASFIAGENTRKLPALVKCILMEPNGATVLLVQMTWNCDYY